MPSEVTAAIAPMEPMDKHSGRPSETKKPINKVKVYIGVQGVLEAFCVFLGIQAYLVLKDDGIDSGMFFAVAAIMSLLVCANVGGQLVCKVSGNFRRCGSSCHLIFLLIAIGLSLIPIFDFNNAATLCRGLDVEDYDVCDELLDPLTLMLIYVGFLVNVFRLITIGLMLKFCCCSPPSTQTHPV